MRLDTKGLIKQFSGVTNLKHLIEVHEGEVISRKAIEKWHASNWLPAERWFQLQRIGAKIDLVLSLEDWQLPPEDTN